MADPKQTETRTDTEEDEELSALLDSAVNDFKTAGEKKDTEKSDTSGAVAPKPVPPDSLWNQEFMRTATSGLDQTIASRFEQNMASLFTPTSDGTFNIDQLGENLSRLAEASTQAAGFDASPDNEFSSIIANTLRNLTENTDSVQNDFADFGMNMLGSLGNAPDGNSDPGELLPFMQKIMQNIFSKEILHPAMSNIVEKYPAWLEENKGKVSEEDFAKYTKQFNIMKDVCGELEKESSTDSEEVKKVRFEKILGLMQEVQDCGQPPADLVEMGPTFDDGRLQLPPDVSPEQCCIQ